MFKRAWSAIGQVDGAQSAFFGIAGRAITAVAGYCMAVEGEGIYLNVF
jgi:hypothetical protein